MSRVASGASWGNGDVYLTSIDVANPDALNQVGQYTLQINESLTSARFDGPRGYLVTYRNIDPLFTFDLADPRAPRLLGDQPCHEHHVFQPVEIRADKRGGEVPDHKNGEAGDHIHDHRHPRRNRHADRRHHADFQETQHDRWNDPQ